MWVYLREAFDDERLIESILRGLATRTSIVFRTPMTTAHWSESLRDPNSSARQLGRRRLRASGAKARLRCAHDLFPLPLCVLAGEAGTGKTTVVGALLQAIERTEGAGDVVSASRADGQGR